MEYVACVGDTLLACYLKAMNADDLKTWRASLGLTQKAAAEALGISRRTLEGWEAGRPISYPTVLKLALDQIEQQENDKCIPSPPNSQPTAGTKPNAG